VPELLPTGALACEVPAISPQAVGDLAGGQADQRRLLPGGNSFERKFFPRARLGRNRLPMKVRRSIVTSRDFSFIMRSGVFAASRRIVGGPFWFENGAISASSPLRREKVIQMAFSTFKNNRLLVLESRLKRGKFLCGSCERLAESPCRPKKSIGGFSALV